MRQVERTSSYHDIFLNDELLMDLCRQQVRVMTALRHPNVVLFMAACTKPPKMCIVMEFMGLGSLFDVCILFFFVSH